MAELTAEQTPPAYSSSSSSSPLPPPWDLGPAEAARCAALLTLSGQLGDFVVSHTPTQTDDYNHASSSSSSHGRRQGETTGEAVATVWVNAEGMPRTCRCIMVRDGKGHSHAAIVRSFDAVNEDVLVQWCDGLFVTSMRYPLDKVRDQNPRLRVHTVAMRIRQHKDKSYYVGHGFDRSQPSFPSIPALIRHYQRNSLSIRTFEAEGDRQYIKLAAQGRSWQLLQETYRPSHNKIVRADWALPLVMGCDEVNRLLTGHWCQAGDFVLRFADPHERENDPHAVAYLSMLTAIRVHHLAVLQCPNGLYYLAREPLMTFATLGQLVDYVYINLKIENIPCRRVIVPDDYFLSHAHAELPAQATYVLFGRDMLTTATESESEADRMSSTSDVAADLDEFSEQLLQQSSKVARRQADNDLSGHGRRRPLPLRLLAMANNTSNGDGGHGNEDVGSVDFTFGSEARGMGEDDESMPFNDDLRDIHALESYEATLEKRAPSPPLPAPHAQTSFILGVSGPAPRGEEQEALLKHFSPLPDALSTMQGMTNLDRMPLPRSSLLGLETAPPSPNVASSRTAAQVAGGGGGADPHYRFVYRRGHSASAPAGLNGAVWNTLLQDDAQDEIDDVFG